MAEDRLTDLSYKDKLGTRIVTAVAPRFAGARLSASARETTRGSEAHVALLLGRTYPTSLGQTRQDDNAKARKQFQCPIDLQPGYAPDQVGLEWTCWDVEPEGTSSIRHLATTSAASLRPDL